MHLIPTLRTYPVCLRCTVDVQVRRRNHHTKARSKDHSSVDGIMDRNELALSVILGSKGSPRTSTGRRRWTPRFEQAATCALALVAILLGACAQQGPMIRPSAEHEMEAQDLMGDVPDDEVEPQVLMADVPGDKPLPALRGAIEQIDCTSGVDKLHARMALEARGGQIASFAFYSKWKPRTCSLEIERDDHNSKWRLTADGATRVQTPYGGFLIRARSDAYVFEFQNVQRQRFCGMTGFTNGTMTVKRTSSNPECSVEGLLDRDDEPLGTDY
jgi:hypothetical protein